jgi:two-component system, cell cycle sensor histidine kinase and response regulator CckA
MKKTLVVDDNKDNLLLLQIILKREGYDVMTAGNGVEALEKARCDPPDIVITDILMPLMDGFTLCREWQKDERLRKIPLVFYTATYTDPKDEELALSLGAARFVVKPQDPEAFVTLVRQIIKEYKPGPPVSSGKTVPEEADFYKLYSETLVRKLEDKMLQLEKLNQALEQEITERKQSEEALRESEERYRNLFENANEAIFVVQDGKLVFLNPMTIMITGYSGEELMASPFSEFIYPDDRDMVSDRHVKRLKGENLPHIYSFQIIRRDGNVRWVELNAVLINWKGKKATLNFLNDITERKRMEEELLKADKLESVGILAGGIAHDFNNILTSISGNISMAKMLAKPGDKSLDLLNAAESASVRAQGLTRQLLTFAKGGETVKETASIKKLIKESSIFVLRGSKSECEFQIAEDLWPVDADLGQISQVITNITINANQAMPEGGIIRITAENIPPERIGNLPLKPGRHIRISIIDQGVGIPEKHLSKIFDPYFTTKQAGSGLGLASAYSIIKKHNGYISVDSRFGTGTGFHIYLPASDKEVPVKDKEILLKGHGKILMMDDDQLLKEMSEDMLDMLGYESAFADDGDEAIEKYRKAMESGKPYDAVILDLTIPGGMGGKEAIKMLLEMDPDVKAIVFSGYAEGEVLSNYREHGFKAMMKKPFDMNVLGKVLKDVLGSPPD